MMASRATLRPVAAVATDARTELVDSASFDRSKRSFLAAMSHELRTPLNAIIGFAEIMDTEMFGPMRVPQYRHYIRDILDSGRHLLRIIEGVVEITQAQAREMVLTRSEVPLKELVASARAGFDAICVARKIRVIVRIPDDLVVRVDPDKFRRVLVCLLSNAVKFGKDGGRIMIAADVCDLGRVTIRIEDDGIGIDPSAIEQAFAPFVQLDDKLSRCFEGIGLGLPLARMVTELHGGTVELVSAPGTGTTAIVILAA